MEGINVTTLSEEEKVKIDDPITLPKLKQVLKLMPRNKTPGNDGLPTEFYLTFFDILGPVVNWKCINENFKTGILTCSQRQASVSLLDKSGKDNHLLKSWPPISLINVDAKIINKILWIKKYLVKKTKFMDNNTTQLF